MERQYLRTHPWLTFDYRPRHEDVSMRLGEAYSKCQHLAGTPLQPGLAERLSQVYLAKGVAGTTAIEGNTLTEAEVAEVLANRLELADSQSYLAREVLNVQRVLAAIDEASWRGEEFYLSPHWLAEQNRAILEGLEVADHVVPGEYTKTGLVVGSVYRGAPPEDVPYLVQRLCDWVNDRLAENRKQQLPPEHQFANVVTTAILAHLYLVWVHPFGDGNGRTARAHECAILATSEMVPWISANLLSDYYNRTRSKYYARLAAASRDGDVHGFIKYALDGFVELLREQIADVQRMQREVAWINYVHERLQGEPSGDATKRRRTLALTLPNGVPTPRTLVRRLSPELAELYAGKADKTLSRDLNRLVDLGLVVGDSRLGYRPNIELMDAFLPTNLKLPVRTM